MSRWLLSIEVILVINLARLQPMLVLIIVTSLSRLMCPAFSCLIIEVTKSRAGLSAASMC